MDTRNTDMRAAEVRLVGMLDEAGRALVQAAMQLQMSARAFHRLLKLSRTIADLAGKHSLLLRFRQESPRSG